jgi:hypothetical protein
MADQQPTTDKKAIYNNTEINIKVFFNPQKLKSEGRLNFDYSNGSYILKFVKNDAEDQSITLVKKVPLNHMIGIAAVIKKIIGERITIARAALEADVPIVYPELDKEYFYTNVYYDKSTEQYVENGGIKISTVNYEGANRIAIAGVNRTGESISVVLFDDSASKSFVKLGNVALLDMQDSYLYLLGHLFEKSCDLSAIMVYNMCEKFLHTFYRKFPDTDPNKLPNEERRTFFTKFKKDTPNRTAEVKNNSPTEEGEELFDEF